MMIHTLAAAPSTTASNGGAAVILIALSVGIFFWLKGKLTVAQLIVCGMWGLLLGSTTLGSSLHGPLASFGNFLTGLAG